MLPSAKPTQAILFSAPPVTSIAVTADRGVPVSGLQPLKRAQYSTSPEAKPMNADVWVLNAAIAVTAPRSTALPAAVTVQQKIKMAILFKEPEKALRIAFSSLN